MDAILRLLKAQLQMRPSICNAQESSLFVGPAPINPTSGAFIWAGSQAQAGTPLLQPLTARSRDAAPNHFALLERTGSLPPFFVYDVDAILIRILIRILILFHSVCRL
jgi:hypothetical protein